MTPLPMPKGKPTELIKSWKKVNEERKALKRQRKQENLLKSLEKNSKLDDLAKTGTSSAKPTENPSTISIAVPGSILENAQSAELRTYVAGQIARAASIFRVIEVVVFDDVGLATARDTTRNYDAHVEGAEIEGNISLTVRRSSLQLARILQYLECPQYLRKFFFPLHKDLQYSGLLNPLDAPHHLRQQNHFIYREGIISDKKAKQGHSYANVGLLNDVLLDKTIPPGMRVTVKLENTSGSTRKLRGIVVSPDEPRRETGVYWGYTVRIAHSVSEIFTKSPYEGGYDLTVGTSDRGASVHDQPNKSFTYNHLLIVFGGLNGLEEALANDDKLDVEDPALLFDHYINVLPKQGSRTIRTEEALLIAMAALQEKLNPKVADVEEDIKELLPRSEDTGIKQTPRPVQVRQMTQKQEKLQQKDKDFADRKGSSDFKFKSKSHAKWTSGPLVVEAKEKIVKKEKEVSPANFVEAESIDFEVVAANGKIILGATAVVDDDLSRFD